MVSTQLMLPGSGMLIVGSIKKSNTWTSKSISQLVAVFRTVSVYAPADPTTGNRVVPSETMVPLVVVHE